VNKRQCHDFGAETWIEMHDEIVHDVATGIICRSSVFYGVLNPCREEELPAKSRRKQHSCTQGPSGLLKRIPQH